MNLHTIQNIVCYQQKIGKKIIAKIWKKEGVPCEEFLMVKTVQQTFQQSHQIGEHRVSYVTFM